MLYAAALKRSEKYDIMYREKIFYFIKIPRRYVLLVTLRDIVK